MAEALLPGPTTLFFNGARSAWRACAAREPLPPAAGTAPAAGRHLPIDSLTPGAG
jgi:hypothetical protein